MGEQRDAPSVLRKRKRRIRQPVQLRVAVTEARRPQMGTVRPAGIENDQPHFRRRIIHIKVRPVPAEMPPLVLRLTAENRPEHGPGAHLRRAVGAVVVALRL